MNSFDKIKPSLYFWDKSYFAKPCFFFLIYYSFHWLILYLGFQVSVNKQDSSIFFCLSVVC